MASNKESLHSLGWTQGAVFTAALPYHGIAVDGDGNADVKRNVHSTWIVVTQDCNLARTDPKSNKPSIEVRQVMTDEPPSTWGINARKFLLDKDKGHYLVDDKPSSFVSPKFLTGLTGSDYTLAPPRVSALKTWLGKRYDRPAVPEHLVDLARAIAGAIQTSQSPAIEFHVRDVYMTFDPSTDGMTYSLYAAIVDGADVGEIEEWLVSASLSVEIDLGVLADYRALRSSEISLELIESAYCADLSQLTWGDQEGPDGAF